MRFIWTLSLVFVGLTHSLAQGITSQDIQAAIATDSLTHPYLLFDQAQKAAILQRVATDPESQRIMDRLLAEADMLLYQPVDPDIPPRPTHVRAGWTDLDRENAYGRKLRSYRGKAQTLAFVYQMTGETSYAQKAYEFAEVVCRLPLWTLQAHEFEIIYSRVWPWNVDDDQVNFNFDLGSATTGQTLAWVYDWTYDALSKPQRDRLRGALLEKAITPVRGDYEFHWWAASYRCNWTGVCNGGLGMVALALLKEYPQLADVVAESYNRIDLMMNQLGVDGGWQEGGSYWRYGMDRSALFAYALKRASEGKYNLFENERLQANPVTFPIYLFVPPDRSVNFGDAHDHRIGGSDFFNLLTTETQSPTGAWYREAFLGPGKGMLDLIFPRPSVAAKAPVQTSRHFRDIVWWVMRSRFTDENKVTVAGKVGKSDDPHHGHLDVGHFILFWRGEDFLKDSGRPYYDEEYFDEARWDYPQASSAGHNVISVNGEGQIPGKLKGQPFNYEVGGKVLRFSSSPEQDYVLMDPTRAYPGQELKAWQRHLSLDKVHDVTLVRDEITTASEGSAVSLRYHSGAQLDVQDSLVLLRGKNGSMALIPLCQDPWELRLGQHAYQPVHATRDFEWLPYLDIAVTATGKQTEVLTVILPVENLAEAKKISRSAHWNEGRLSLVLGDGRALSFALN
ncbi:MAG: heparinase II/III family protein [Bacteroidota bacterium]